MQTGFLCEAGCMYR